MTLVDVEVDAGVATLTLSDPSRRNTLTVESVAEFIDALDAVETDAAIGGVVVTGAGSAFCAGADLALLAEADVRVFRRIYEAFRRLHQSPLPTVSAINGPAVGAGMNLALACDLVVAGASATFDSRFAAAGLHPGGGHTWLLSRRGGSQAAAASVLFGERWSGADAVREGLAYECVADDQLLARARSLAARAARLPRPLAASIKTTLREIDGIPEHDAAIAVEAVAQQWSVQQNWFSDTLDTLRRRIQEDPSG